MLVLGHTRPELVVGPWVAVVDIGLLALVELVVPETLRGSALRACSSCSRCTPTSRASGGGLALAAYAVALLLIATAVGDDGPTMRRPARLLRGDVRRSPALRRALMVGRLRTAESASRLRARGLSRRTIQAESEVRRRVAESIHDGPVQELIGLDMVLSRRTEGGRRRRPRTRPGADRRGPRAGGAQHPGAARRDRGPRPIRLRGAQLRHRGRELHAHVEAPLRRRGAGHARADRTARRSSPADCSASPRRP